MIELGVVASSCFSIYCLNVFDCTMHTSFVTILIMLFVPDCSCKGMGGRGSSGRGSSKSSSFGLVSGGSSSTVSGPPPPPPPPPCQALSDSVSLNLLRERPCSEKNPCAVVVNGDANTAELCLTWSPNSFWDGSKCMCRCELLGGALDMSSAVPMNTCVLDGAGVSYHNQTGHNAKLFLAPIKCGTWLGARDSAWKMSWFASDCFNILENRFADDLASVKGCGVDRYTTGCRFLDTNQRWVPECRTSNLTECGVKVACPPQNPCGLGATIDANLDNAVSNCPTQTHLALNVSADETNCYSWNENAFLLDGYCVSSCGRLDNQCELDGVRVPPCNTVRTFQDNSIISISPTICAVPMPSDTFAGFRNGFYGMSRLKGSQCLLTVNCSSRFMCFHIEGLDVTPLFYSLSAKIPVCNGDLSQRCKIEYPCPVLEIPVQCDSGVLGISEAIWVKFGVYSCPWFTARDAFIIIFWIFSFFRVYGWLCGAVIAKQYNLDQLSGLGLFFIYLLALSFCVAVSCVWEFAIMLFLVIELSNWAIVPALEYLSSYCWPKESNVKGYKELPNPAEVEMETAFSRYYKNRP